MKILFLGDTHLRYMAPSSRTDDFFQVQLGKFTQVLDIYEREGCSLLIQAGDLVDSPRPPNILMSAYIRLLKGRNVTVHSILGQHDISMHSLESVGRSAIDVFRSAGILKLLGKDPLLIDDVAVYGASFGEPVPSPRLGRRNILVVHKMIGVEALYPGHDIIKPRSFLHNYKGYEFILCGDYHYRFFEERDGRKIANCGAMVRLSVASRDLELVPCVGLYDTLTKDFRFVDLNFRPSSDVFIVSKGEEDSGRESVLAFIERLKEQMGVTVSFRDNLRRYFDRECTPVVVQEAINQAFEEVSG